VDAKTGVTDVIQHRCTFLPQNRASSPKHPDWPNAPSAGFRAGEALTRENKKRFPGDAILRIAASVSQFCAFPSTSRICRFQDLQPIALSYFEVLSDSSPAASAANPIKKQSSYASLGANPKIPRFCLWG
jgi:hypothetical protein